MLICNLERILARRHLSQRALARTSGVHRTTIARLCRDEWTKLDRVVLDNLCEALRIPIGQLLVWEEDTCEDEDDAP